MADIWDDLLIGELQSLNRANDEREKALADRAVEDQIPIQLNRSQCRLECLIEVMLGSQLTRAEMHFARRWSQALDDAEAMYEEARHTILSQRAAQKLGVAP
jgi:hypothetical protein